MTSDEKRAPLKSPCFVFNGCYNGTIKTLGKSFMKLESGGSIMDDHRSWFRAPALDPGIDPAARENPRTKVALWPSTRTEVSIFTDVASILFFETDEEKIFGPGTGLRSSDSMKVGGCFPSPFVRSSQSTIVSTSRSTLWKSLFRGPAR